MSDPASSFSLRRSSALPYVVYVPEGRQPKGLPVILYLHGRGESGTDGWLATAIGLPDQIRRKSGRWPFLVLIPQKPQTDVLWPAHRDELNQILRNVQAEFEPDPHRRYITGLSQGGNGTFELCESLDWNFAAAAPVCGWVDPTWAASQLRSIPIWAFHGDKDPVVPVTRSIEAVEAIVAAGGEAKLTRYPDLTHNSWDAAYNEGELPSWFLSHEH